MVTYKLNEACRKFQKGYFIIAQTVALMQGQPGNLDLTHTKILAWAQSRLAKDKQSSELACVKFFLNSWNFLLVTW